MAKGIIVVDDIPKNCFHCKLKEWPNGMSFPEDRICTITGQSIFQYKPHNINGTKPDWCPIKAESNANYSMLFETNEIRVKTIKFVSEIVGAALMDCKKALERNEWDITKAIKYLRNRSPIEIC